MLVPKLRFKRENGTEYSKWNTQKLSAVSSRVIRKNKGNVTDIPLTIASLYGLVDQREYFKKTIASQNMEGYYLLYNGEFAYNKSYSNGFDFGAIKRLDRYDCGALSTLYICFAINDKVNSDFMTHYFDSQKWNKEVSIRCAEGARNHGLLNISTDDFFDIDMTLPTDLEEQQKIADFLSIVDEVIAQSEAEVQNLVQQKKAAMQKIFSQEVRFKREDGTDYPEWEYYQFGDFCETLEMRTSDTESYPLYSLTIEDGVTPKTDRYVRDYLITKEGDSYKIVPDCAFVYNPMNLRFGALKVNHSGISVCVSGYYDVFYIGSKETVSFWENYLTTSQMLNYYDRISTGSLIEKKRVYYSEFQKIKKQLPCVEEQRKIADFLSAYDEAISYAKQELEHWKQLKKGLLQQMFV